MSETIVKDCVFNQEASAPRNFWHRKEGARSALAITRNGPSDRVYLAGCALTGLLAHGEDGEPPESLGRTAVEMADAVLAALEEKEER